MKWFKGMSGKLALLMLSLSMVIVAGCQAVGGLDLNEVLKKPLNVTSSEGYQTIELKFELDEELMEQFYPEDMEALSLFSELKLELTNIKLQDRNTMSLDGKIHFGDVDSIGFKLAMAETSLVVELEGAKQPFVLDLSQEAFDPYAMYGYDDEAFEEEEAAPIDEEALTELGLNIIEHVGNFAINNLPNPDSLKVAPVFEQINGEYTSLMRVQFEMNGAELWQWLNKYVSALIEDRDGLSNMLEGILEVISSNEALWDSLGGNPFETDELDAPTIGELAEEASEFIAELLVELQDMMAALEEEDESFVELLKNALTFKVDLHVDGKLDIRKQQLEARLNLAPFAELELVEELPLKSVAFSSISETWNINGAVTADTIAVDDEAFELEYWIFMEGYEKLQLFEQDSFVYTLLKDHFGFGNQQYAVYNTSYYNPPIIMPGYITIASIRDVAEAFGAEVIYDHPSLTITVVDEWGGNLIEVQIGSDIAVVNGEEVQWPLPATVIDGTTYVPARKLAEALGASIDWLPIYEDIELLSIERNL